MLVVSSGPSNEKLYHFIGCRETRMLLTKQIDMWKPVSKTTQFMNFEKGFTEVK